MSVDLLKIIQIAETAINILGDVAKLVPGPEGKAFQGAIENVQTMYEGAEIKKALIAVQDKSSAKAQEIADKWKGLQES